MTNPDAILKKILSQGTFPDPSFSSRLLRRVLWGHPLPDNTIPFSIERHPNIFGRPSLGRNSSAYATIRKDYLLDVINESVEEINEEIIDVNIDYEQLAEELVTEDGEVDVSIYFDEEEQAIINNAESVCKVTQKASERFSDLHWKELLEVDGKYISYMPKNFEDTIMVEIKKEFIDSCIKYWQKIRLEQE